MGLGANTLTLTG